MKTRLTKLKFQRRFILHGISFFSTIDLEKTFLIAHVCTYIYMYVCVHANRPYLPTYVSIIKYAQLKLRHLDRDETNNQTRTIFYHAELFAQLTNQFFYPTKNFLIWTPWKVSIRGHNYDTTAFLKRLAWKNARLTLFFRLAVIACQFQCLGLIYQLYVYVLDCKVFFCRAYLSYLVSLDIPIVRVLSF